MSVTAAPRFGWEGLLLLDLAGDVVTDAYITSLLTSKYFLFCDNSTHDAFPSESRTCEQTRAAAASNPPNLDVFRKKRATPIVVSTT